MVISRSHEKSGAEHALDDEELTVRRTLYAPDAMAGHRVIITGGGTGVGKATAVLFSRLGAEIAICGRREENLAATAELIKEATGRSIFFRPLSIRDPDSVENFIAAVHNELGGVDTLVNNAGGQFSQNAIEFSRKGWQSVIDTNLNGTWWMMQEAAKIWRDREQPGNIVNVVCNVERGLPQFAHTCASRAAVIYLSKTLSVEWAPLNIRVNCLGLGAIKTEGFRMYQPENLRHFTSNPMKSMSDAFEMAEAIVYMSSPAARFMNGSLNIIDGGQAQWGVTWAAGQPEYYSEQG